MFGPASALLLWLAAQGPAATFKMSDQSGLALAILSPPGAKPRLSFSELARTVESVVVGHTDLIPVLVENVRVEACGGKLSCIAQLAMMGEGPAQTRAPLLLVLSVLPGADRDLLGAAVIDLGDFRRRVESFSEDPEREDKLEASIADTGLIAPEERRQIETDEDVHLFLERLLMGAWRPGLERLGHWEPYGAIEIAHAPEGAVLRVDEASLGTMKPGLNRIERVRPGARRVSIQRPSLLPFEASVMVTSGGTASLEAVMEAGPGSYAPARAVVFWSGLGELALGTTLLVVRETSVREPYVCVPAAGCDGGAFEARGLLAIGAGLATGGAVMALGTLLFGDDSTMPWLQLVLGVGVGVGASLLTTAL